MSTKQIWLAVAVVALAALALPIIFWPPVWEWLADIGQTALGILIVGFAISWPIVLVYWVVQAAVEAGMDAHYEKRRRRRRH